MNIILKNLNEAEAAEYKVEAEINENVEMQLNNIIPIVQSNEINENNFLKIEQLLEIIGSFIDDCHATDCFNGNNNKTFGKLLFEYEKLTRRYESYKAEKRLQEIEKIIENLNCKATELSEKQEKSAQESNKLVYTILSFIASFSIISASVSAIVQIQESDYIFLFIAFIILLLITTLIALDNFYKPKGGRNPLQSNYFLWIVMAIILSILLIYILFKPVILKFRYDIEEKLNISRQEISKDENNNI